MKSISTSKLFCLLTLVMLMSIAGCGLLTPQEQIEAQLYATLYARDHTIPPPKYQTLAAQYYGVTIPEAVITPSPMIVGSPTMSFYDFSGTQVAQQQSISLTNQANQMQMEREQMAAEAKAAQQATQAYYSQETAVAFRIKSTAQEKDRQMIATANAQGTQMMYTAAAASTATTYQQIVESQGTQLAAAATQAVLPTHAIWTLDAIQAQQTIEAGEASKVKLAVRRQELRNGFDALLPWTLIVSATIVIALGFMQFVKTRVHTRDEHGAVPLLQMRADNGDTIFLKAENMETGVTKIQKDGSVIRYAPMDAQEQSDITRRNQAVEAIRALPTPYAGTGAKIITSEFSTTHARVTVGNPSAIRPALDEAEQGLLEEVKSD